MCSLKDYPVKSARQFHFECSLQFLREWGREKRVEKDSEAVCRWRKDVSQALDGRWWHLGSQARAVLGELPIFRVAFCDHLT